MHPIMDGTISMLAKAKLLFCQVWGPLGLRPVIWGGCGWGCWEPRG